MQEITWELRASNGTIVKVHGVEMSREVADVPDCDNPDIIVREYRGPLIVRAIVSGT